MKFCKHTSHKVIDDIMSPKWSTDEVLINVDKVSPAVDNYILQFSDESPKKKYGWFYLSGKDIRKSKTQANGRGRVYVVSMNKREEFTPVKDCMCMQKEFDFN